MRARPVGVSEGTQQPDQQIDQHGYARVDQAPFRQVSMAMPVRQPDQHAEQGVEQRQDIAAVVSPAAPVPVLMDGRGRQPGGEGQRVAAGLTVEAVGRVFPAAEQAHGRRLTRRRPRCLFGGAAGRPFPANDGQLLFGIAIGLVLPYPLQVVCGQGGQFLLKRQGNFPFLSRCERPVG